MKRIKTVSLCMIVKNEEKYLAQCIQSVKDVVDEMIIVDTGSTDQTVAIATSFGAEVYHYNWNNNFSEARNLSLSKATSEWLLLLDADEMLASESKENLIEIINTSELDGYNFKIYNYNGSYANQDIIMTQAFRLLRNNRQYEFKGSIHEQIVLKEGLAEDIKQAGFSSAKIILYHYGYLQSVIKEKDKRNRNIPLIQKELEREPNNGMYLLNLANEYMADKKLDKAIQQYELARKYSKSNAVYLKEIFYRLVVCLVSLEQYDKAMEVSEEALSYYPKFIDIAFYQGIIFSQKLKYTLAISAFEKCIEWGKVPEHTLCRQGLDGYMAYFSLGEIYLKLDDFDCALKYFNQVLNSKKDSYAVLYQIGNILNKKYKDKEEVAIKLGAYFSSLKKIPNLTLYIDILIKEQLYEQAQEKFKYFNDITKLDDNKLFIESRLNFFTKQYELAYMGLKQLLMKENLNTIFKDAKLESLKLMFVIALILKNEEIDKVLDKIEQLGETNLKKVYSELYCIYQSKEMVEHIQIANTSIQLQVVIEFLDRLLKLGEKELLKKYLDRLKRPQNREVYLQLAKLYQKNALKEEAKQIILESIKVFGTIDSKETEILIELR